MFLSSLERAWPSIQNIVLLHCFFKGPAVSRRYSKICSETIVFAIHLKHYFDTFGYVPFLDNFWICLDTFGQFFGYVRTCLIYVLDMHPF